MLDWILFILLLVSWLCSFAMLTVYNTPYVSAQFL